MTKIPPPNKKGSPPQEPSLNLQKTGEAETVQLKFDVPAEFRRDLKMYATRKGLTHRQLLERMFEHYQITYP